MCESVRLSSMWIRRKKQHGSVTGNSKQKKFHTELTVTFSSTISIATRAVETRVTKPKIHPRREIDLRRFSAFLPSSQKFINMQVRIVISAPKADPKKILISSFETLRINSEHEMMVGNRHG